MSLDMLVGQQNMSLARRGKCTQYCPALRQGRSTSPHEATSSAPRCAAGLNTVMCSFMALRGDLQGLNWFLLQPACPSSIEDVGGLELSVWIAVGVCRFAATLTTGLLPKIRQTMKEAELNRW